MSGVYIKGMEMPRGCAFCELKRRNGKKMACPFSHEEWDIHDPMSADYRLLNCPLLSVPNHGRLIEKGKTLDVCYTHYEDFMRGKIDGKTALLNIEREIKAAPTIIPTSEEVYDKYIDTAGNLHWTGTQTGHHIIPADKEVEE